MALYLVQHGKNNPKDVDPEQHLSAEGREEVSRIAKTAQEHSLSLKRIDHSPKERAKETAEIFASFLNPEQGVSQREGLKALDDVQALARSLGRDDEDVMLVGHLPFMEKLVAYLVAGREDPPVLKFQNGGIVCLRKEEEGGNWVVDWTLLPRIG